MSESEKLIFIHAYLTGDISSPNAHAFDKWLHSDPKNLVLFNQVSQIWQSAIPPDAILFDYHKAYQNHLDKPSTPQSQITLVKKSNHWARILTSIAATFLIIITFIVVFESKDHTLAAGEIAQMHVLPDGSKAWLQKNAVISYNDFSDDERNVNVSGIVFFDVMTNKKAPFKINTDGFEVKVIGTEFLVNVDQNLVAVKEGIVEVKNRLATQRVTKDHQLVLKADGTFVQSDAKFATSQKLWFNDDLIFKNTPFDKVIKDLSDNFNVKISIPEKETWSTCTFTSGSLKNSSLDQILEILKLTYDLEYSKQKDNSIKLTSVKCR